MEYRKLPHGKYNEQISVLGLGFGWLESAIDEEIESVVTKAIDNGINFFDLCAGGKNVYKPFGNAIKNRRKDIYFQLHFGAIYNEKGEYGFTKDFKKIKETFEYEMSVLNTDYIDFGFLHCIDQLEDLEQLMNNGTVEFVKDLKEKGIIRYIGFSSHTPSVAEKVLDLGFIDMMMFSINPAYDFELGNDDLGIGSNKERMDLFRRCEKEGIGISVMKPFHAGKLLDAETSSFGVALSIPACIKYALDRPGVLTTVPGVRGIKDLDELLLFLTSTNEEKDYSIISKKTSNDVKGICVYCNHCHPCPKGINIALVNKYYDLALMGDKLAIDHYKKLIVNASDCIKCGHCNNRCPFKVKQQERMTEIKEFFERVI